MHFLGVDWMNSGSLGSKKGASLHKVAGGTCMLLMIFVFRSSL